MVQTSVREKTEACFSPAPLAGDGGAPAAGRLTANGTWDPNFYGTGQRVYPTSYTFNFFQLLLGPTAYLWESTDGNVREVLRIDNQVTLDSSITKFRKRSGGRVSLGGLASSPTGISRVGFAIAPAGSAPSVWTVASGTHFWSASVVLPRTRKKLVIYSRAIGLDGATESEFSTADKNRLVVR